MRTARVVGLAHLGRVAGLAGHTFVIPRRRCLRACRGGGGGSATADPGNAPRLVGSLRLSQSVGAQGLAGLAPLSLGAWDAEIRKGSPIPLSAADVAEATTAFLGQGGAIKLDFRTCRPNAICTDGRRPGRNSSGNGQSARCEPDGGGASNLFGGPDTCAEKDDYSKEKQGCLPADRTATDATPVSTFRRARGAVDARCSRSA